MFGSLAKASFDLWDKSVSRLCVVDWTSWWKFMTRQRFIFCSNFRSIDRDNLRHYHISPPYEVSS